MKKRVLVGIICGLVMATGCQNPEENLKDNTTNIESPSGENQNDVTDGDGEQANPNVDGNTDTDEQNTESNGDGASEGDNQQEETNDDSGINGEASGNDDAIDDVSVDAYPSVTEPIEYDPSLFDGVESLEITDQGIIDELNNLLYHLYFNYYFELGLEEESGNVTIGSMELFALSYIMQNEHHELRFDPETFRLEIPVKQVRQVVAKFFYRNLDVHNSYEDLGVIYDRDYYSIIVENGTWDETVAVAEVFKLGDFSYRVVADVRDKEYDILRHQIEAVFDETADGLFVVNYTVVEPEIDEETEE